ncbi:DUF1735 domain-containing protein [Alistipes sp.]|uniref:BT_3987 domain-containing protein n=1 Tax=Alistipes sp. TaxID=1872444 RepID=UPI0025C426CD|nr:DUF1735 domain-containing protein [Alistipes sp.]
MKKILMTLAAGVMALTACQNELYNNPLEDFVADQGAYIDTEGPIQIFVEENKEYHLKDIKIGLSQKGETNNFVSLTAGSQEQLDRYNAANGTSYLMLPPEMYDIPSEMEFKASVTKQILPVTLKDIRFSMKGEYALPVSVSGGSVAAIPGSNEGIIILEKLTRTKVLRFNGSDSENAQMFPNDFKVDYWTLEFMINRDEYFQNNMAIAGTKLVENAGPHDEIYTRFGDVTIEPNQFQIKTGSSQIDVDKKLFAAQPNTWYMISIVYDGKFHRIYVNGGLVAEQEIRSGAYGLIGFWISGKNQYIREVRFWDSPRTEQQVKNYVWKMVNPEDEGLLLYYPCNGKKRDMDGNITEDVSMIWNWATKYKKTHPEAALDLPAQGSYPEKEFVFPLQNE